MKFFKTILFLFVCTALGGCPQKMVDPEVTRLDHDLMSMAKEFQDVEDQLKKENEAGKKHELYEQRELLKSRMDRVRDRLESKQKHP
jgi:phosphoenolpyruvate carboxylase